MSRWSKEEIEMFKRAREDLDQKYIEILISCARFNKQNPDLLAEIVPPNTPYSWYFLVGTHPASATPGVRAERYISGVDGRNATVAVNPLEQGDLEAFGTLAAQVGQEYQVQIRRKPELEDREGDKNLRIVYEIKPDFDKFKESNTFSERE